MRLLSWNCRGLVTLRAVGAVKRLMQNQAPDVVFLMETRKFGGELTTFRGCEGLMNMVFVDCLGHGRSRAGGLFLLWRNTILLTVLSLSLHRFHFSLGHPFVSS